MQVKKQQLELNMEQQTDSKLGKEYIKAVYCHPAYMQSTSCEMLGGMKHKLKSRLLGEISITSDMQMTPHLWEKVIPGPAAAASSCPGALLRYCGPPPGKTPESPRPGTPCDLRKTSTPPPPCSKCREVCLYRI